MTVTVLVTGGAGYIGSHVCKALAEAGDRPVCYDTLEKGHDWAVQWGPLERGDIGDKAQLDELFGPIKYRIAENQSQIERDVNLGRVGRELFPLLILLVAALLGGECLLANRFYREVGG